MLPDEKKLMRLTAVLRMYYEKEMSQLEIAKELGVSRPMVSKMLTEAKQLNMVTITINEVHNMQQMLSNRIEEIFKVRKAVVVNTQRCSAAKISEKIAQECYALCGDSKLSSCRVGVGFGSMIGQIAEAAENKELEQKTYQGEIFPLIGGIGASYKSYHTNELVRVFSELTGLKASYMYLPALLASAEEKNLYRQTELYADIERHWASMNVAIVNISSLYATPDLATSIRFGNKLKKQHAVGRCLAHYYDIDGNFIEPERDNAMQADLASLKKAKYVIGLCSEKTGAKAAVGALRTGLFTHVVLPDELAQNLFKFIDQGDEK